MLGAPKAHAQTQLVPQDTVVFDVSQPGVLVVDASDHKTFMPLLAQPRTFADMEEYGDYLRTILNFAEPEPGAYELFVSTLGQTYTYSPDLQSIIPVADPVATFLGGRYGTIRIGQEEYCVDPDRCQDAVHYYLLSPLQQEDGVQGAGVLLDAQMTTSSTPPFTIHGYPRYKWSPSPFVPGNQISNSQAVTNQKTGGFQIHRIFWEPASLQCTSFLLGETECHFRPGRQIKAETSGRNRLKASVIRTGRLVDHGSCYRVAVANDPYGGRWASNVPSVVTTAFSEHRLENWLAHRFEIRPTHLEGFHEGEDLDSGANDSMDSFMATGWTPDCYLYSDPRP